VAGYSGTPLWKKLGIKPASRLLLVEPPAGVEDWLRPLPDGVARCGREDGALDVIVCFVTEARRLQEQFGALAARLAPAGGLWIAWPKKSARQPTDLDENRIRAIGLAAGLVDNKVCAVSETWSGLRFVVRLRDRPTARA
jgi:hypothetical protein